MPWITKEDRVKVETNFKTMKEITEGEATYLFYKRMLKIWKDTPKYKTIHFIGMLTERPELDKEVWELRNQLLFKALTHTHILQSIKDAHHQMTRLYFDKYEDEKLQKNGEVEI